MKVNVGVRNYYTDILCHEFNPGAGDTRMVVGTNFGDIYMITEDQSMSSQDEATTSDQPSFSPVCAWHTNVVAERESEPEPVVALAWDTDHHAFFLTNKRLYHMGENDLETGATPQSLYGSASNSYDFMHFAILKSSNAICLVTDDGRTTVLDKETQKMKFEFKSHDGVVQVCKATDELFATGSIDGYIHLYDGQLRTNRKICSFGDQRNPINNLDISRNSVWLTSCGVESSEFPTLYNIQSRKEIPVTPSIDRIIETERISALHFDSKNSLYWGGNSGTVVQSSDFLVSTTELTATYGLGSIPHILSITTKDLDSGGTRLSVAGATNGVLFSSRYLFWDSMIHVDPSLGGKK